MKQTTEQTRIITELHTGKNLAINSGAGTGKTHTVTLSAVAYLNDNPYRSVRLLAFNNSAAREMWARLTENNGEHLPDVVRASLPLDTPYEKITMSTKRDLPVWAGTLNSLGYQLLVYPSGSPKGRFLAVDEKKYPALFQKHVVGDEQLSSDVRQEFYKSFLACLNVARQNLGVSRQVVLSPRPLTESELNTYMDLVTLKQGIRPIEFIAKLIPKVLNEGYTLYRSQGLIDLGDQLWLPYICEIKTPYYDLVIVDECQDVDPCQRWLIERFHKVSQSQIVIVGDKHQAIYAWRGADIDSMQLTSSVAEATELQLSENFRCPKTNIRVANKWHPELMPCSLADEQEWVKVARNDLLEWIRSQKGEIAVLCRRNKPLVELAAELRMKGIPFSLKGGDTSKELIEKLDQSVNAAGNRIDYLANGEVRFYPSVDFSLGKVAGLVQMFRNQSIAQMQTDNFSPDYITYFTDLMDTLLVIVDKVKAKDFFDLRKQVRAFFTADSQKKNQGLTIHRAKGGQWENVIILDADEMISARASGWAALIQEWNGWYVASTRTKIGGKTVYTTVDSDGLYPVPSMTYDEMYRNYKGLSSGDELGFELDSSDLQRLIAKGLPDWV